MSSGAAPRETDRDGIGWLGIYLRGMAMGLADAVPGVSGGTIALITGIYDRLIDAVAGLSEHWPDLLDAARGDGGTRQLAIRRTLVTMDLPFLVVLGLGVLTGVLVLANLIEFALHRYRAVTFAFFFGVILASPLVLRREVSLRQARPAVAGLLGIAFAFWFSGLPYRTAEFGLPVLFLVGAVAISAMVLPGISGSLVLLIIGAYGTIIAAVSGATRGLATMVGGGPVDAFVEPATTLFVFAVGAFVGVLTFARLVSAALDAYRVTTMTLLVGIMIGALRTPAREILTSVDRFTPEVTAGLVAAGAFGVVVVGFLEFATGGLD